VIEIQITFVFSFAASNATATFFSSAASAERLE
jgi:hypothetical protein